MKKYEWKQEVGVKDSDLSCQYLTYVPQQKYNWNMNFVSIAEAQSFNSFQGGGFLSAPLYLIIFVFLAFTVTMSLVYLYHWVKFNLNDPFIKNFTIIYFIGLCALLLPLLFTLIR